MPTHAEKRTLPYRPDQLFDLVAEIERYPEFLPWCRAARIRKREGDVIFADLVIGWKMIRESFTSRVTLKRPGRIDVSYHEGPFKYLNNHWTFEPLPGPRSRGSNRKTSTGCASWSHPPKPSNRREFGVCEPPQLTPVRAAWERVQR